MTDKCGGLVFGSAPRFTFQSPVKMQGVAMTTFTPTVPPLTISDRRHMEGQTRVHQGRVEEFIPKTFAEMYRHYYGYVVRLIAHQGISPEEAEDVAQIILTHFFRRDAISFYSADFTIEHQGKARTVKFTTFLSGFVLKYLRYHVELQQKRIARMPESLDAYIYDPDGDTWLDLYGPRAELDVDAIEYDDSCASIRTQLADVRPKSEQDKFNAVAFFDALRAQIDRDDRYDLAALAAQFGVATSTAQSWMKRLRAELR